MKINNQAIAAIESSELGVGQASSGAPRRIALTDLSYLRFLSVLTNQPLKKVARMVSREDR